MTEGVGEGETAEWEGDEGGEGLEEGWASKERRLEGEGEDWGTENGLERGEWRRDEG